MSLSEQLQNLDALKEKRDQIEELLKSMNKQILEDETKIVEESQAEMINEIKVGDKRYKLGFKHEASEIQTNSDHTKKVELYKRLIDLGCHDDIQFFETCNMHRTKFKAFVSSLPHGTVNKLVADGLLNIVKLPDIRAYKVKA